MYGVLTGFVCGGLIGFKFNRRSSNLQYLMQLAVVTIVAIAWYIILFNMLAMVGASESTIVLEVWFEPLVVFIATVPPSFMLGLVHCGYVGCKISKIRRMK